VSFPFVKLSWFQRSVAANDISTLCRRCTAAPTIDYEAKFKSAQQLKAGASIVIPVKIGGIPAPKVEWSLKDEPLTASPTVIIETTEGQTTLTLKSLTGRSTGKVKVTATNSVGKASAEFDVAVKGESNVSVHKDNFDSAPGQFLSRALQVRTCIWYLYSCNVLLVPEVLRKKMRLPFPLRTHS